MNVLGHCTHYFSRRDMYGNSYHAFRWTDNETGHTVEGTVPHSSNLEGAIYDLTQGNMNRRTWNSIELPIREFNRLTKGWAYARCTGEEIARFIRTSLEAYEISPEDLEAASDYAQVLKN